MSDNTKNQVKPREWWIDGNADDTEYSESWVSNRDPQSLTDDDDFMDMKSKEYFHVVEAAPALMQLNKLKAELVEVKAELAAVISVGVEMQREANRKLSAENDELKVEIAKLKESK